MEATIGCFVLFEHLTFVYYNLVSRASRPRIAGRMPATQDPARGSHGKNNFQY